MMSDCGGNVLIQVATLGPKQSRRNPGVCALESEALARAVLHLILVTSPRWVGPSEGSETFTFIGLGFNYLP